MFRKRKKGKPMTWQENYKYHDEKFMSTSGLPCYYHRLAMLRASAHITGSNSPYKNYCTRDLYRLAEKKIKG